METIFKFIPVDSPSSLKLSEGLTSQEDFQRFLRFNTGKSVTGTFCLTEKLSEKERLYAYYHKVILNIAIELFSGDGWEAVDKVKADYLLKAECAKSIMYNRKTDTEEIYLIDKASMNKDRLRKYIIDCITYLEVERGCIVPDSSSYMMELKSGISGFVNVNQKKK